MADNLPQKTDQQKAPEQPRLVTLLATPQVRGRFDEMLGKKSAGFVSSIISAYNTNEALKKCEPMSIIASASIAASLDLPINPSLGFAHIVPYDGVAQFQIGWKGFVQLALRSGQYKTINMTVVLEGQLVEHDVFKGTMKFQQEATSPKVAGYLLYFQLLSGYEKFFYMTAEQMEKHAKQYSASYRKKKGRWVEGFDDMGLKTVAKLGLSKYGILSIDMQKAFELDAAVVDENGAIHGYPDNPEQEAGAKTAEVGGKKKSRVSAIVETTAKPQDEKDKKEEAVKTADVKPVEVKPQPKTPI